MDPRDELFAVEGLGHIIIGAKSEAFDFILGIIRTGQNEDRRLDFRKPKLAQNLMAVHIRQV